MSDETYIISAAEIAAMEGLAKTHFMNPNAQRVNKSLGDMTGLTGIGVHIIEVQPGHDSTEHHVHHHEDEYRNLPMATAVSLMRFEKPHSLSYHVRIRTIVPSRTLVWSRWKIDDRGSWLKSMLTIGRSV